jgi:hypothetical protein
MRPALPEMGIMGVSVRHNRHAPGREKKKKKTKKVI